MSTWIKLIYFVSIYSFLYAAISDQKISSNLDNGKSCKYNDHLSYIWNISWANIKANIDYEEFLQIVNMPELLQKECWLAAKARWKMRIIRVAWIKSISCNPGWCFKVYQKTTVYIKFPAWSKSAATSIRSSKDEFIWDWIMKPES